MEMRKQVKMSKNQKSTAQPPPLNPNHNVPKMIVLAHTTDIIGIGLIVAVRVAIVEVH